MAVIALPNIEPQGPAITDEWELRSITAMNRSPLNGVATTLERVGAQWAVTLKYNNLNTSYRARMQQFLANCRGHGSRFYVPYYGWTNRGSFSAPELFSNNHFASGTTGWSNSNSTLTAADGVMRVTASAGGAGPDLFQSAAMTQYAPHALRSILIEGPQTAGMSIGRMMQSGGIQTTDFATTRGLGTVVAVAASASAANQFPLIFSTTTGFFGGVAYISVPYASLARCALVDNAPNLLQRSDEFDNAYWTKTNCSITANVPISPDGTTTADEIIENGAAGGHNVLSTNITVSSSVLDYALTVCVKANNRNWCYVQLDETTGATAVLAYFNLSSGAVGVTSTGANWADLRTFAQSIGNNWWRVTIVVRKTNAATVLQVRVGAADADGGASYTGTDTLSAIYLWRATLAQSSVPSRIAQTTSAATSGSSQTGSMLRLKGLPVSTNGLLLAGDLAEVITGTSSQLVRARAPLNSDAAGLGNFEFEAPIRVSPSDNAAVILQRPLCRMMLDSNTVKWTEHSGGFCDLEFTAVEDTYP